MKIPVAEIFGPTIQGEGPNSGCKCIFVRVVGCDFKCEWCFGIDRYHYRVPRVIQTTDKVTSEKALFCNACGTPINEISEGDKILTYDENNNLVETEVKQVLKRKANCLRIKVQNRTYLVTPEHPFFTKRGLIPAGELTTDDEIVAVNDFDLQRLNQSFDGYFDSYKYYNMTHLKELAQKFKPYYEHLYSIYEQTTNNLGVRNGNYQGGNDNTKHRNWLRKAINEGLINVCSIDGSFVDKKSNLIIHHIDEDETNDDFDNLIVISRHYHDIIHERGFNFTRRFLKQKNISYKKVKNITPHNKEVDVINFSCEPYNTYLADGMLVHNCDSKFAWKVNENTISYDSEDLSNDLIIKCKETHTGRVIITGGNPCLYDFTDVVDALHEADIKVDVETQGSKLPNWLYEVDQLVISPKAPSSGQPDVYENIQKFLTNEFQAIPNTAIKIPVFNDEDFEFAKRYNTLASAVRNEFDIDCRLYINVGNTDTFEGGSISERVLSDYEKLIDKVCKSNLEDVYIMPQIHTLVWRK